MPSVPASFESKRTIDCRVLVVVVGIENATAAPAVQAKSDAVRAQERRPRALEKFPHLHSRRVAYNTHVLLVNGPARVWECVGRITCANLCNLLSRVAFRTRVRVVDVVVDVVEDVDVHVAYSCVAFMWWVECRVLQCRALYSVVVVVLPCRALYSVFWWCLLGSMLMLFCSVCRLSPFQIGVVHISVDSIAFAKCTQTIITSR